MVIHQRVIRESKHAATTPNTSLRKVSVPSHAARAQTSGKSHMNQLARELSESSLPRLIQALQILQIFFPQYPRFPSWK